MCQPPGSRHLLLGCVAAFLVLAACNDDRTLAIYDKDVFALGGDDRADGDDLDGAYDGSGEDDADAADGDDGDTVDDADAVDGDFDIDAPDADADADATDADADADATDAPDGTDADVSPSCGDGVVDAFEACDDGEANSDDTPDACRTDCTLPVCGDGVVDSGELCDDGNTVPGDSCSPECEPPVVSLCTPCSDDAECGSSDDLCLALETGSFCGSACTSTADCPDSFSCMTIDRSDGTHRQCVPVALHCEPCLDFDGDGYGTGPECLGIDCDEDNPAIHAGAAEVCDGLDNDCDDQIDEPGATGGSRFYADGDSDGWGREATSALRCGPTDAYPVDIAGDCDDANPSVNPGAADRCDGLDNDCDPATADGSEDPEVGQECDSVDVDLCPNGITTCVDGELWCAEAGEPVPDVCDGFDNDCDPSTPDGADDSRVGGACDGADADACAEGSFVCRGGGIVCNDATGDNVEECNGLDDDCDDLVDEDAGTTWYPDTDGDSWGVTAGSVVACAAPIEGAWASRPGDCGPTDAAVNPDATEVCGGGVDDDCDDLVDCADDDCAASDLCDAYACIDGRLGSAIGPRVASGSNATATDARTGSCNGGGRELEYLWTAPAAGRYVLDTIGSTYNTVLAVLAEDCGGAEVVCNDDLGGPSAASRVTLDAAAGATYVIVIDARSNGDVGTYQLNIAADIDEVCDNVVDDDLDTRADCDDRDCELFPTCCPADVFEPNEGTSSSPSTTWDAYSASPGATLTVSTANIDSFRVPVCYRARVSAVARFDHSDANVDLRLIWPNGTRLATAASTTDDESLSASIDIPFVDRVFLQAYVTSDTPACTEYTIEITVDRSRCF